MTLLVGSIFHMTRKIVSEMTYNVSMGTLNPTIPYHTCLSLVVHVVRGRPGAVCSNLLVGVQCKQVLPVLQCLTRGIAFVSSLFDFAIAAQWQTEGFLTQCICCCNQNIWGPVPTGPNVKPPLRVCCFDMSHIPRHGCLRALLVFVWNGKGNPGYPRLGCGLQQDLCPFNLGLNYQQFARLLKDTF